MRKTHTEIHLRNEPEHGHKEYKYLYQHPDKGTGKEIPREVNKSTGYYNDMRGKKYFTL